MPNSAHAHVLALSDPTSVCSTDKHQHVRLASYQQARSVTPDAMFSTTHGSHLTEERATLSDRNGAAEAESEEEEPTSV